ncbi:TPA: hypothetical protein N0F65_008108 [Lagenidium giganteum]|uniref:RRM domain-containing protein n=1 Tax=Lagenidium giganteum TaxID=4803 RepID=A0AAV2YXY4_9STRA|nr:TPA: hypothetical protein N0F65_008108 [Lagenidium giganteum]
MAASTNDIEMKLDMSLDQITEQRKSITSHTDSPGGKTRNTKRAGRMAQSSPYPHRRSSQDRSDMDVDMDSDDGAVVSPGLNNSRRVFVGNLAWSVRWQDLKDHMSRVGPVERAEVMEGPGGRSKGCGLVTYVKGTSAFRALSEMHDTELEGRKITVRVDQDPRQDSRKAHGYRVYVGNLAYSVKWQDLKDHMKQAGHVVHAGVLEEINGRSKGCGLVEYATFEEAQQAIQELNDTELDGRLIFVREDREPEGGSISAITSSTKRRGRTGSQNGGNKGRESPRSPQEAVDDEVESDAVVSGGERQIYVGNLPWTVSWQKLKDMFKTIAEVERADVAAFPDGRSKGYGIVRFFNSDAVHRAIEEFNEREVEGRRIQVRLDKRG